MELNKVILKMTFQTLYLMYSQTTFYSNYHLEAVFNKTLNTFLGSKELN